MTPEVYYEVEVNPRGTDDWIPALQKFDTTKAAEKFRFRAVVHLGYDSRIVEVTVSRKVVA